MIGKLWTVEEAIADFRAKHPDCTHADWANGLGIFMNPTIVVKLWRNEECFLADDPPKHVSDGYPCESWAKEEDRPRRSRPSARSASSPVAATIAGEPSGTRWRSSSAGSELDRCLPRVRRQRRHHLGDAGADASPLWKETTMRYLVMIAIMGLAVSVTMDWWDFAHHDDPSKQTPALLRKLRRKISGL